MLSLSNAEPHHASRSLITQAYLAFQSPVPPVRIRGDLHVAAQSHRPSARPSVLSRRRARRSPALMCEQAAGGPGEARRELDARGFVLPRPGDLVLFPGRWADEDGAGLVEAVRARGGGGGAAGAVVDVVEMRSVGDDMFETTRNRRWFDVAEVRIAVDAQYVSARDSYRVPSARSGYAAVAPMDEATRAQAAKEYADLKGRMLRSAAVAGAVGTGVAAVFFRADNVALAFGLGAAAGLLYLAMLQASVDVVGRMDEGNPFARVVSNSLALRFAVPALPFVVLGIIQAPGAFPGAVEGASSALFASSLGALSKQQAAAVVLGLLTYKVPILSQTAAEAVDSLAEMPLNTGMTGMIGTSAGLLARALRRRSGVPAEDKAADEGKPPSSSLLLVLAGPSGCGKSTLIRRLFADYPDDFKFSVSHTTRPPRANEEDGVDYNFVDLAGFEAMVEKDEFVEHAKIHGNRYGTSRQSVRSVLDSGRSCILDLDVQGVQALAEQGDPAWVSRFIWIAPPSLEALQERLEKRGSETPETLAKRMDTAMREISYAATSNVFDRTIVNDDVSTAYIELVEFIDREKAELVADH